MGNLLAKVGTWAFLVGIILALAVGVTTAFMDLGNLMGSISTLMAVLGLVVGLLNVTDKEVNSFIIAAIGLTSGSIALANLGPLLVAPIGTMVAMTFTVFGVFVAGAVFIPALKAIYSIAKDD